MREQAKGPVGRTPGTAPEFEHGPDGNRPALARQAPRCPVCGADGLGCRVMRDGGVQCYARDPLAAVEAAREWEKVCAFPGGPTVYRPRPSPGALTPQPAAWNGQPVPDLSTTPSGAVTLKLATVQPEPVRWLRPGRLAIGKLTLLAGDPGLGKSLITLDVTARVSSGAPWPDAPGVAQEPGGVVLLTAEDDLADTVRPRVDAAGADVGRIVALRAVRRADPENGSTREAPFNLAADLDALEQTVRKLPGCRLVIVDPISAYLPGGRHFDSHKNTDVRIVLAPLGELAARCGVAVVAVTHLRKGDGAAIYRAMGSLAFVAAARAVWAVARDRGDGTGGRRLLLPVKSNLSPDNSGLAFAIGDVNGSPVVRWEPGAVTVSTDDALAGDRGGDGSGAVAEATDWLREALAAGPVAAQEVKRRAAGDGIALRTLDRAKTRLGVRAAPDGYRGPWVWHLPGQSGAQSAPTAPQCAKRGSLAQCGKLGALWEKGREDRPEDHSAERPPDALLEQAAAGAALDGDDLRP